ncbi:MAG TPA: MmcQ/YjbR family DNA-binding protein [Blastocatellia bacterium]|nr:MmcQ/YjbR family DNA-binding protein [Blastocatellia bacterium]
MDIESLRKYCLSFPNATEQVQWGSDLLFKIGGKIFAVTDLNGTPQGKVSFKCTPEKFTELIELEGIIPAPYVARYHWVYVEKPDALSKSELKELISHSYEMVFAKLPKKVKEGLKKR